MTDTPPHDSEAETANLRNVGFRTVDLDSSTATERVREALDVLEHVREHHSVDNADLPPHKKRTETPPALATIDEMRRQLGHGKRSVDVTDRLAELKGDSRRQQREREDLLSRLDTVEDHANELARPEQSQHAAGTLTVYPFGRSHQESVDRITDAVETVRDVLTPTEEFDGWGMAAYLEDS